MNIKKYLLLLVFELFIISSFIPLKTSSQTNQAKDFKSLLWEISGNGLQSPSYLFGTMHMLCKDDAVLGDSLIVVIEKTERIYFELDLDNLFEMFGALKGMKMKNDTTLADLLSEEDYNKVKEYIEKKNGILPFSELEKYKPILASSMLMESGMSCGQMISMEQLIMEKAKKNGKRIEGLESMGYQMSIFDSIPYKLQAEQLLKYISEDNNESASEKEFTKMMEAYKDQDLEKLAELINGSGEVLENYYDLLINNRNTNWVNKLKPILPERAITIAVGAGHLPGEKGLINLFRKAGYILRPVKNIFTDKRII